MQNVDSDFFFKTKHQVEATYHCTCHFPQAIFWEVVLSFLWRDYMKGQYLAKPNSFLLCMLLKFFLLFKSGFMLKSWLWSLTTTELVSNGNLKEWKSWDSGFFWLSPYKHKRTEQLILSLFFPVSISNSLISEWEEHLWHTKEATGGVRFCTLVMHQHGII